MATIQCVCLAVFALGTLASAGSGGMLEEMVMRFGALALVGFMVIQNYRQQRATNKVLERKDQEGTHAQERLARLTAEQTEATNRLAKALEDRPCLVGEGKLRPGHTST